MGELTTAEVTYSGEWRVSLDDGEAVFVEETIVSRIGSTSTRVVSRVTRLEQNQRVSLAPELEQAFLVREGRGPSTLPKDRLFESPTKVRSE